MAISINLEGVKTELEAVPPGNYSCTISSVQHTLSKRSSQPMLAVQLRIDEPEEEQGRLLFDNFSLQRQALWKLKRWMLTLGWDPDELESQIELDPEEFVGMQVVAVVTNREQQQEDGTTITRSSVSGYAGVDDFISDIGAADEDEDEEGFDFDFD